MPKFCVSKFLFLLNWRKKETQPGDTEVTVKILIKAKRLRELVFLFLHLIKKQENKNMSQILFILLMV